MDIRVKHLKQSHIPAIRDLVGDDRYDEHMDLAVSNNHSYHGAVAFDSHNHMKIVGFLLFKLAHNKCTIHTLTAHRGECGEDNEVDESLETILEMLMGSIGMALENKTSQGYIVEHIIPEETGYLDLKIFNRLGFLAQEIPASKKSYVMQYSRQPMTFQQILRFRARLSEEMGIAWHLRDQSGREISYNSAAHSSEHLTLQTEDLSFNQEYFGRLLSDFAYAGNHESAHQWMSDSSKKPLSLPCDMFSQYHCKKRLPSDLQATIALIV